MREQPPERRGGDELMWREIERWRDSTPEERLAECARLCEHMAFFLSVLPPDVCERVIEREPLPEDTIALLESLWRARRTESG